MTRTHRVSAAAVLIVCLVGGPWAGGTLFAAEEEPALKPSPFTLTGVHFTVDAPVVPSSADAWRSTFNFVPSESTALAQRRFGRGRRGGGAAAAAIIIGAAAVIGGAAILVYANRPECSGNQSASGCGYGTKVAGGAVVAAGVVGITVGALTWR